VRSIGNSLYPCVLSFPRIACARYPLFAGRVINLARGGIFFVEAQEKGRERQERGEKGEQEKGKEREE